MKISTIHHMKCVFSVLTIFAFYGIWKGKKQIIYPQTLRCFVFWKNSGSGSISRGQGILSLHQQTLSKTAEWEIKR